MIVGAGLAGLIAAHVFPQHQIVERRPEPINAHRALLRFRSAAVSELTGVPFREVTVRKGVWSGAGWTPPTIHHANAYSRKVVGRVVDRSIWDLEPVTRWVAPESFYFDLVEAMHNRITWGADFEFPRHSPELIINTAPLPTVLDALGITHEQTFARAPISVMRFALPNHDVFQTVYYPAPYHSMYRASITGDLLICEFAGDEPWGAWRRDLEESFDLRPDEMEELETARQEYGKIVPIPNHARRAMLGTLTEHHGIYSVGRFATWRNILLDDVVHDAMVVKRLATISAYERRLENV